MKFIRLYLKAYGPFQDRVIDLPISTGKDLHLIFGPNEAGKSTILRAVTGFLFGIPERTSDAFLHGYTALRVGATLLLPDGSRLSAMRRKGRRAVLFPIDEMTGNENTQQPLEERVLSEILGGLDETLYQHLFGLDLAGLVAGSEELLRGEGEVGRSLFQAAAGLGSLRNLISGLDEEATSIFKPRGSTSRLNRALEEFDGQRRILKTATVRSSAWETVDREHRQSEAKYTHLRDALKGKRGEQQKLDRIRANLPLVAERAAKQAELTPLVGVPLLRPEASQCRVAAQERLRAAQETEVASKTRLAQIKTALDAVMVRQSVLDHATEIERAFHMVSGYRAAREAMPEIAAGRAVQVGKINPLLGVIDPKCALDQAALVLPAETLVARVQSLVEEHARLIGLDEQLDAQIRAKNTVLDGLNSRLGSFLDPPPVDELESSLAGVANAADLEARQRKLDRDISDVEERLQREAASLWGGTLPELIALAVPLPETAVHFESEFSTQAQDERLVVERVTGLTRDLEERCRELRALAATGEVVTQTEVAAARSDRDEKWSHVRRAYVEHTAASVKLASSSQADRPVAIMFEEAIREADRLADLLHADTQRATNLETTRQRITDMQEEVKRHDEHRRLLAGKRLDLQQRWTGLIKPLRSPELTPVALREWLLRHERLMGKNSDLRRLRQERESVAGDLSRTRVLLERALATCRLGRWENDEPAADALARAQKAINAARKLLGERDSVLEQIESAKAELLDMQDQRKQVTYKLNKWWLSWSKSAEGLRLDVDALPAEAKTRLDQLARLSTALNDLTMLDGEASSHAEVVDDLKSRLTNLAKVVEESTGGREPDVVSEGLYTALQEARDAETVRQQLFNDLQRETEVRAQAVAFGLQATIQLDILVQEAECGAVEDLPKVELKAARKEVLQQRLVELDEQLVKQSARQIDDVVHEAEGFDLDGLTRQAEEVATQIEDLEGQVDIAQTTRFGAKQLLDAIDGGPAAAETQQAILSLSARIGKEARSYARVRLAGAILSRVVQVYRDRHQGPLLQRAAEVFARITLGSFGGLTVDYEDDRQVLLGVRPNGSYVPVAGMSQGARDQLFLSLRLASIEQHIEGRGQIPVIIDDLLVQFDDERAVATLEVLRELSQKTQVLFFTHHRHLVELAQSGELASGISIHNL